MLWSQSNVTLALAILLMAAILALRMTRKETQKFKVIFGYMAILGYMKPYLNILRKVLLLIQGTTSKRTCGIP